MDLMKENDLRTAGSFMKSSIKNLHSSKKGPIKKALGDVGNTIHQKKFTDSAKKHLPSPKTTPFKIFSDFDAKPKMEPILNAGSVEDDSALYQDVSICKSCSIGIKGDMYDDILPENMRLSLDDINNVATIWSNYPVEMEPIDVTSRLLEPDRVNISSMFGWKDWFASNESDDEEDIPPGVED